MQYENSDSIDWEGPMLSGISKDDISIPQIQTEHKAKVLQIFVSKIDALQNFNVFGFNNHLDEFVKGNIFFR